VDPVSADGGQTVVASRLYLEEGVRGLTRGNIISSRLGQTPEEENGSGIKSVLRNTVKPSSYGGLEGNFEGGVLEDRVFRVNLRKRKARGRENQASWKQHQLNDAFPLIKQTLSYGANPLGGELRIERGQK